MEQKLAELNSPQMSSMLKDALITQEIVPLNSLDNLLSNRDNAVDQAKKQIQAICYAIDYQKKALVIFDTYTNEIFHEIPLPSQYKSFSPDDFDAWGTSISIMGLDEIQKEYDIPFDKNNLYGLAIAGEKIYLYNSDIEKQNFLAVTDKFIFGANSKTKNTSLPYDMYFSKNREILCLANRDEGKINVFSTKENKFIDEISVRVAGSFKAINIAISDTKKTIYITDNQSSIIITYDIVTKKLTKKNLALLGILGNICLSPDEKNLFTIIIKPEPNFKIIATETFDEIKSFQPKGDFFSLGDDPSDLLALAPNNHFVFYMTYLNDPHPFTPVITVIDIEKNKAVKRFSIKDGTKPISISFLAQNPIGPVNKNLEELLIENGYFTFNKLRDFKLSLLNSNEDEVSKTKYKLNNEDEENKSIENEVKVESEVVELDELKKGETHTVGKPTPKKTKHIIIPVQANKQIKEILVGSFWQKTEIDLTEVKEDQERLDRTTDNIRKKLEYYDIEVVDIKNYFGRYSLETVIQRDYILEMLHEEESIKRQKITAAPTNCSNCTSPLFGSWECPVCGFVYEKPEDAIKRKLASFEAISNLPKGHFFILDKEKGLLIEMDNYRVPIWAVSKDDLGLKSITRAYRLDNKNTMIFDKESNTISEISPRGREIWKFDLNNDHTLITYSEGFNILEDNELIIVDTHGHTMVECTLDGEIVWKYGSKGSIGKDYGFLNTPTDVQKTYEGTYLITDSGNNRVLEVQRELNIEKGTYEVKIIWEYSEGLNKPVQAFKEINGDVLVLDKGNKRIVQINPNNGIVWEYSTSKQIEAHKITNPQSFLRMKNKDMLIIGDNKVVSVFEDKLESKVIWSENIDDLEDRITLRVTKDGIKKAKEDAKTSGRFGKSAHDLFTEKTVKTKTINASHYMRKKGEKPEEEIEVDQKKLELERIIEERKKANEGKFEGEKPNVIFAEGKQPLPFPILIIDKNENKVLLANRNAEIKWQYGDLTEHHLIRPQSIEVSPDRTIVIGDTDRAFELNMVSKEIIWQHQGRVKYAVKLKTGNFLICDEKTSSVLELDQENNIIWAHKEERVPTHAVRLGNGNTLVTISSEHFVKEIAPTGEVVWCFGGEKKVGSDKNHLSAPEHASRLTNGNTLIADTRNSRVIEVSPDGEIVWKYQGNSQMLLISPTYATRLKDGNTYIIHSNYKHILEVDPSGKQVWRLIMPSPKNK